MKFKTKIMGFECYVNVIHYASGVATRFGGAMEDGDEPEPPEFDYEVEDLDGNDWPALYASVTDEEEVRLFEEYEAAMLAEKYGKDF